MKPAPEAPSRRDALHVPWSFPTGPPGLAEIRDAWFSQVPPLRDRPRSNR